jgi:hypothetical protein
MGTAVAQTEFLNRLDFVPQVAGFRRVPVQIKDLQNAI